MQNTRIMIQNADLNVMFTAITRAARSMVRDFGEVENLQVSRKAPGNFVSVADMRSEKTLVENLSKARPTFGFLLEESGEIKGKEATNRWIIDPLDGTSNFIHAIPHFCISVALEKQGEITAAMIYDPISDELYYALKGSGAFVNEKRLRVAARPHLDEALVTVSYPHTKTSQNLDRFYRQARLLDETCSSIRRMGSAALELCMVAGGKADGFISTDLEPWDIAAGILIVKEAGGFVSDPMGGDMLKTGCVVAGNESIHNDLCKLLK